MKATLAVVRSLARAAHITGSRDFASFLADRISVAFVRPTLVDAVEQLARLLDSDVGYVGGARMAAFIKEANELGERILRWIREHPQVVAMLCMMKDEKDFQTAIDNLPPLPEYRQAQTDERTSDRPEFDIPMRVEVLSGLAHGSDTKAGNTTTFRRRLYLMPNGATVELPVYGGNALRGQIRDLLADRFLLALGISPRRDHPEVSREFFYMLYAGGALEGGKSAPGVKTDEIRELRDNFPHLSLLGTSYGNRVLPGRCYVNDLRPRCREHGNADISAAELLEYVYLTRREDFEGRADDDGHRGMIAMTEVLKTGVVLDGGIDIDTHANELERSALGLGLTLLQKQGRLGAQNRMGIGYVRIDMENVPDPAPYQEWLRENRERLLEYMRDKDYLAHRDEKQRAMEAQAPLLADEGGKGELNDEVPFGDARD